MKNLLLSACAAALLCTATSCNQGSVNPADLKTAEDSLSFYLGNMWGNGVASEIKNSPDSATFNAKAFIKGIKVPLSADTSTVGYTEGIAAGSQLAQQIKQINADAGINIDINIFLAELESALTAENPESPQNAQMIVMKLIQNLQQEQKAKDPKTIANKNAGLAAAKKAMEADPGFVKAESGIVYKIINEGKGENFTETDRIDVIYVGKHIDGTVFDDSKGEARQFSPMQVVPGFKEALMMMKPGAKMQVYIPGELGYGVQGQGQIGAMETLVFDIETPSLAK
ncbi:MAG: FKBP-type peptidyl-prolyl cis-trans isomerase [Bacteroidales bacterium]